MTVRVAIVGTGPAGFTVAATLLADTQLSIEIDLIERAQRPDGSLRHGPAAGAQRLKEAALQVDSVLGDPRVSFFGGVEVGSSMALDELRRTADAVVLATGAPRDAPMDIAGHDSVGIGTISHLRAWLAGSADVGVDELDLAMDSAALVGVSPESLYVAEVLCGRLPPEIPDQVADRLANSRLRYIQLIDSRSPSEMVVPEQLPNHSVLCSELTPVGVVGRNRARAVRCVHRPDPYGRVVTEDVRAQLLLRPHDESLRWRGLDEAGGHIAHLGARVLSGSTPVCGLYVAGWAGRDPAQKGSHADDAATVLAAIRADCAMFTPPDSRLVDVLSEHEIESPGLRGWSAVAATDELLARFASEGRLPLADYQSLMQQVDED